MSILHWIITGILIAIPVAVIVAVIVMLTLAVSGWVRRRKGARSA